MADAPDANDARLIRFLLRKAQVRGALVIAPGLVARAAGIHGLAEPVATLFGQTLIGSMLLLSIAKGGIRQVLQLDGDENAPIRRMLAEARQGAVRGYLVWHEEASRIRRKAADIGAWMGSPLRVSTVRDLGFGQPYVSTIESDADYLADHLVHHLARSAQVRADVALAGGTGLMIEAMPGADDDAWFDALGAMAAIGNEALAAADAGSDPRALLRAFDALDVQLLGEEPWRYRCDCDPARMAAALAGLGREQIGMLTDDKGRIALTCQYCGKHYSLPAPVASGDGFGDEGDGEGSASPNC